jgi:hypothetical protein
VTSARLDLTRAQILAYRRAVGHLDERLPSGAGSLRRAAWAGLQDSMPRAAVLSLHARVEGIVAASWEDPALVQLWGPRYSAHVVAAPDVAIFTLGRLPDEPRDRRAAQEMADRLRDFVGGRRLTSGEVGRGLGINPNALRYAAPTGTALIRWDGARQPTIWTVAPPTIDPGEARLELARRYLRVFGPTTGDAFAGWAGIPPARGRAAFEALAGSLAPVRTPIGDAWVLAEDEPALRADSRAAAATRLLPSGDAFFLLHGTDRELLVPDPARRAELWPSRVWPGAVLVAGEPVGTWRRSQAKVTIHPWRRLTAAEREAVEAEAASLPLPDLTRPISVTWAS